eukprot:TRINITY_DN23420_c0_g1_i1.p1 TRINITY_DN23420_c0_g1~~TRINITY_DN23420_c0_g1_i1.p1  ORF type:complete len:123 (+),score=23.15 TRINITY_DN23420_c0_g1_i1:76-444(+)
MKSSMGTAEAYTDVDEDAIYIDDDASGLTTEGTVTWPGRDFIKDQMDLMSARMKEEFGNLIKGVFDGLQDPVDREFMNLFFVIWCLVLAACVFSLISLILGAVRVHRLGRIQRCLENQFADN